MRILSPLDAADEVDVLVDAGAGEFFCGLLDEDWYRRYPVISVNRRPAGTGHFTARAALQDAVGRAHARGVPVYLTMNEHYYVHEQYDLIQEYLDCAMGAGVDALIVADYGLLAFIRESGIEMPLHMSTGGAVFNWRTAAFYIDCGVSNITFPRHLELPELRDMLQKMPPVETTAFILNSRCINVDGYCTFQHGLAGRKVFPMFRNACMLPFDVQLIARQPLPPGQYTHVVDRQKVWERVHVDDHPCGACAMFELREMGVGSLKIVGRGNDLERKRGDVSFVRELIDLLDRDQPDRKAFRARARSLYQERYHRPCRSHMCYYPSVMGAGGDVPQTGT